MQPLAVQTDDDRRQVVANSTRSVNTGQRAASPCTQILAALR
jgi:hypothetical protein